MHPHRYHPYSRTAPTSANPDRNIALEQALAIAGLRQTTEQPQTTEHLRRMAADTNFNRWIMRHAQALADEPLFDLNQMDRRLFLPTGYPSTIIPVQQDENIPAQHEEFEAMGGLLPSLALERQTPTEPIASTSAAAYPPIIFPPKQALEKAAELTNPDTMLSASTSRYSLQQLGLSMRGNTKLVEQKITKLNISNYCFHDIKIAPIPENGLDLLKWHFNFGSSPTISFVCGVAYFAIQQFEPKLLIKNFDITLNEIEKYKHIYAKLGIDGIVHSHRMLHLLRENAATLSAMRIYLEQHKNISPHDLNCWLQARGYYIGRGGLAGLLAEHRPQK